jgi:hypothetical protein
MQDRNARTQLPEVIMTVSTTACGCRTNLLRAALTVILLALSLAQVSCRQLSPEEERALDAYRRSNIGSGP